MRDQAVIIRCGLLIDGRGGAPQHDVAVLIEDNLIAQIMPSAQIPTGEQLHMIDAGDQTVMPGLMDIHVHLVCVTDPQEPHALMSLLTTPPPLLAFHAAKNARLLLEAGFTTVRDLAGISNQANIEVISLKRAIDLDLVPGPRIFAASWVGQTAGHLDMIPPFTWPRDPNTTADGPWEVRKLARTYLRQGADLIKTSASGGFGPIEDFSWRNYTVEELTAVADETHAVGKKLAVHVDSAQGIKNALMAGADTLEHCTFADDESIELMLKSGAYLIPTLTLSSDRTIEGCRRAGTYSEAVLDKLRLIGEGAARTFQKAHQAGIKIATGADIYRSMRDQYGKNAYELELMVGCGMSPMEAIVASTGVAAEALGAADRLGTIEVGKLVDLLIIDGNPLSDIALLQEKSRILVVIKDGRVVVDRRANNNK